MKKIDRLRQEAYEETLALLEQKPHKAVIIRPTGFGKTGILTKLIRSGKYKKILYLYPAEIVKETVLHFYYGKRYNASKTVTIPNVTFMTYMALTNLSDSTVKKLKGTGLIICDECHRLGAVETMQGMHDLEKAFPKAHLVGATATPERMDMIDEISMFFDDRCISKYTLHDAFQDGIIKIPHYAFCAFGKSDPEILAQLDKDEMLRTENLDELGREYAKELIRGRLIEFANLHQMDQTLKHVLKQTKTDTSYQKYIVFFTNFSRMRNKKKDVKEWFQKAFPKHTINELVVSSETAEYAKNVNKLDNLTSKKNHIDLIYSCEMLNLGYHVNDITGIIMYRSTYSNTIYSQQLGRTLSTGDTVPKIVFDIVDNLHRKSVYSMLSDKTGLNSQISKEEMDEYRELTQRTRDKDENGNPIPLSEEEHDRFIELSRLIKAYNDEKLGKRNCNTLYQEDLNLITEDYQATYREIIAKTVAEVVSMRCRQAWARWLEKGGDDSIMTREYILGQKAPQAVPLPPFCKLKNVSVNAVLDEMGVA